MRPIPLKSSEYFYLSINIHYHFCKLKMVIFPIRLEPFKIGIKTEKNYRHLRVNAMNDLIIDLEDIGISQNTTLIHEDNAAVIDGILLGRNSTKSKHIDMRYYSTKQYVDNKVIQLTFVNSEQQCADALTKSINVKRFVKHREVMLGESVYENEL